LKPTSPFAVSLAALALAACSGAPVVPSDGSAAARPADCPVEFLNRRPELPFEPLGSLRRHVMNVPPGGALEVLRPWACALGADAVIVERNQVLNILEHVMVEGTAIRFLPAAPEPVPDPPKPAP
jgi:hypothetical protein